MKSLKILLLTFLLSVAVPAQWQLQNSGTNNDLLAVSFFSSSFGCVGGYNILLRTENGGLNWQKVNIDSPLVIRSIDFVNETTGWFVAWLGDYCKIYKTTDGGHSWFLQYTSSFSYNLKDIQFTNATTGWCVGNWQLGSPVILKTTNGGNTWLSINIAPSILHTPESIYFYNESNGWLAGTKIFRTTDGGLNWALQYSFSTGYASEIRFINSIVGWAGGYFGYGFPNAGFYKTNDGGLNWSSVFFPIWNIKSFWMHDQFNGWTVTGSSIYRYDGGIWYSVFSGTSNLNKIFFHNLDGWAVGANGTILHASYIPVELVSFNAVVSSDRDIKLEWSTSTETNNSGFDILRCIQDGNSEWIKIGFVPGHGTTTELHNYSFIDSNLKPGKYNYKLKQIDFDNSSSFSQIVEVEVSSINKYSLAQNYPNPFNPSTIIKYSVGDPKQFMTLKVFDILGKEISTLVNEELSAGEYESEFYSENLPSGIYFYRMQAGNYTKTKKMLLAK